jgi:protein involved in polysaccharide export with SLBB domain
MPKANSRREVGGALALVAFLATGCPPGNGKGFVLCSEGNRLSPTAHKLRAAVPEAAHLPRELDKGLAGPYTVEPGDVVLVQPANLDSPLRLPGDQQVLPDGSIQLGQYGRLVVAGKTVEQIEAAVNALVRSRTPECGPIAVRLVARESKVFYVLGEVNAPGMFPLKGRETVLDAILAAGGVTANASRRNIILSRPTPSDSCRIVLPVCYNEIVQLGDTSTNYQIQAGDRVFVPCGSCWEDCLPWRRRCAPCGGPQCACPDGVGPPPPPPPPPQPAQPLLRQPLPQPQPLPAPQRAG